MSPDQAQSILEDAEAFLLRPVWMSDDGDDYIIEHAEGELARIPHSQEGHSDALLIVTAINKLPELCQTIIEQAKELARFQRVCDEALPREYIACPKCGKQHIEGARFDNPEIDGRRRPHHTHRCYHCKHVWDSGRWSFGAEVSKEEGPIYVMEGPNPTPERERLLRELQENMMKGRSTPLDVIVTGRGRVINKVVIATDPIVTPSDIPDTLNYLPGRTRVEFEFDPIKPPEDK